jgi:hypothetical protein
VAAPKLWWQYKPKFRVTTNFVAIIVSLLVVGWVGRAGYVSGVHQGERNGQQLKQYQHGFKAALIEIKAENIELKKQLTEQQQSEALQSIAYQALQQRLQELEKTQQSLIQENALYKNIMQGNPIKPNIQVNSLKITPLGDANQFQYTLLLTKYTQQQKFTLGQAKLALQGTTEGQSVTTVGPALGLPEIGLPFKFRYFQILSGTLKLPAQFQPEQIIITLYPNDQKMLQTEVNFPWIVTHEHDGA